MLHFLFFSAALLLGSPAVTVPQQIRQVQVEGNARIPSPTIVRAVASKPMTRLDPARVQADIRTLYQMGYFSQVDAETRSAEDGQVDIVFRVREYPFVSSFSIDGVNDALQEQIRNLMRDKKLEIKPATPFQPSRAKQAAVAVRDYLRARKYPNADAQVISKGDGLSTRVVLSIRPGRKIQVGRVLFSGNGSISSGDLLKQMQYARPPTLVGRFKGQGSYVPIELSSDVERIRRYYQSHGFAAASIGEPEVEAFNSRVRWPLSLAKGPEQVKLQLRIPIVEGARYTLTSVSLEGNGKAADAEIKDVMRTFRTPCQYDLSLLDNARQKMIDILGHRGYALASVNVEQKVDDAAHGVRIVFRVDPGDPVVVGRISFEGNKRLPDKFLRRELRTVEGDVYDSARLDESIEKLNKSNMVQDLQRSDVQMQYDEERNALDITFKVKERDRQGIYGTGGTGGIGGGYLGLLYTAFNLLRLGETLSFELDGGAAQQNILLDIVGNHFLGSYFTVALSAFHRFTDFNVANIVPGPEDLVRVMRRRTTGIGLSGSYPITKKIRIGASFDVARDSITGDQLDVPQQPFIRSEVTPFFVFDSTHGTGPKLRGYTFSVGYGWAGSALLKSIDSTHESFQFSSYMGDPVSKGRNSFAFHLQAGAVHPRSDLPLLLERRFYPGDEVVRGFSQGALTPWAAVDGASTPTLVPAGADTLLGFSAEYRIPIKGPLSSAAFFDIGWTHVNPVRGAQFYKGAGIIEATNGLLRASMGGELRLQLPMIRQPARLIFSWNPLRLDTLLKGSASPMRLADPAHTIRFALGNIF